MPLSQLSNCTSARNKQNTSQVDPQNCSPTKSIKQNKSSPQKKSLTIQNELNLLKIKLSDRQFELKKLQEDCSIKMSQMQKQLTKQKSQKKNLMKQCKEKLDEEKEYYEKKLIMLADHHKKQLLDINQKIKNEIMEQVNVEKQAIKINYQNQISNLNSEINKLNKDHLSIIQKTQSQHQIQKKNLNQNHARIIRQLQTLKSQQLQNLRSKHRQEIQFYKHSQQIKIKQCQVVQKILIQKIKKFQQQVTTLKTDLNINLSQIQSKNTQIAILSKQKEKFRLDSIYWERKHNKLEGELSEKYNNETVIIKNQYNSKISQQIQIFQSQLQKTQALHQQSMKSYESKIRILQERCKKVTQILKNFKSNEDDVRKIQTLEIKLIKKQFQLQKQREDLKMCKLELNNMDQMYHKMFQQAKVKSLKSKKFKLPSLLGQNKSTMDCYNVGTNHSHNVGTNHNNGHVNHHGRQRKFSIRQCPNQNNNQSINKSILKEQEVLIEG